jgi:hypothetical protein
MAHRVASIGAMLNALLCWFSHHPRRLVVLGLWLFFAGALLLLSGALALMAGVALPGIPASPMGFTAAASLVCWGVWALGSGLRLRRGEAQPRTQALQRRG